jgi:hypothetical protein
VIVYVELGEPQLKSISYGKPDSLPLTGICMNCEFAASLVPWTIQALSVRMVAHVTLIMGGVPV